MHERNNVIGIVGGIGPFAGLDVARKVFEQTRASADQDHVDLIVSSHPAWIADRTAYLAGEISENPASGIIRVIAELARAGANVVGIPCNTAHASRIFDLIVAAVVQMTPDIVLVNMVAEVVRHVLTAYPGVETIGVLATSGTVTADVYGHAFAGVQKSVRYPDAETQRAVQDAIYSSEYGLKVKPSPPCEEALRYIEQAAQQIASGNNPAQLILLACTELPLAVRQERWGDIPVVDANVVLARALLREARPSILRGLQVASSPASESEARL